MTLVERPASYRYADEIGEEILNNFGKFRKPLFNSYPKWSKCKKDSKEPPWIIKNSGNIRCIVSSLQVWHQTFPTVQKNYKPVSNFKHLQENFSPEEACNICCLWSFSIYHMIENLEFNPQYMNYVIPIFYQLLSIQFSLALSYFFIARFFFNDRSNILLGTAFS